MIQGKRVAIIGAGLGGLALGQALKSFPAGVRVMIFEKDQSAVHRSQGYQIGIHGYGLQSLKLLNLTGLEDLLKENPMDGVIIGSGLPAIDAWVRFPTGGSFLVNRWKLRDVLLHDLSDKIQWNKSFHHYEVVGDVVKVFFDDGSIEECDLLIGADGVGSHVRKQYRPDLEFQSTGYGSIAGYLDLSTISPIVFDKIRTLTELVQGNLVRLQLSHRQSLLCMRFIASNLQPHILWVVSFDKEYSKEVFGKEISGGMSTDAIKLELLKRVHLADAAIHEVIAHTPSENFYHQKDYLSMVPTKNAHVSPVGASSLTSAKVTLLGDAAHAMTSHAGLGANTAFKDAIDLASFIQSPEQGIMTENWQQGHAQYEQELFQRGYSAVSTSLSNTKRIHAEPSSIAAAILKTIGYATKTVNFITSGRFSL